MKIKMEKEFTVREFIEKLPSLDMYMFVSKANSFADGVDIVELNFQGNDVVFLNITQEDVKYLMEEE